MNICSKSKQQPEMKYLEMVNNCRPLVSIFMLTHNRRKYLELAIESVLNQKYENFILWVLNNSSTDDTEEFLQTIEDTRVLYSNTDVHPSMNMRYARDVCKTNYFIILHDDDILENDYLDIVVSRMEKNDYAELSVAATYIDSEGMQLASTPATVDGEEYRFRSYEYLDNYIDFPKGKNVVCSSLVFPSVIYRTSFYQKIGEVFLTDPGPAGDQVVHFETERNGGTICYLAKPLIRYRIHGTQDSQLNAGFMELQLIDYLIHDEYYKIILDKKNETVRSKLWLLYRAIVGKACRKQINRDKWESFFSYDCIQQLRKDKRGRLLYAKMRMVFHMPHIMRMYYKIVKG